MLLVFRFSQLVCCEFRHSRIMKIHHWVIGSSRFEETFGLHVPGSREDFLPEIYCFEDEGKTFR